jgi:hypothetical protein
MIYPNNEEATKKKIANISAVVVTDLRALKVFVIISPQRY